MKDLWSAKTSYGLKLRHAVRLRGSWAGSGENLGRQIVEAIVHAAIDRRYGGPLTRWEAPDAIIEVWVQIGSSEIVPEARSEKNILFLGVEGVEIKGRGRSAYYKPSVAITSRYKNENALFDALCKKARLEKGAWKDPDVQLWKSQWICLRSISTVHFFGKCPKHKTNLPMAPDRCITESSAYLIRNQDVSGGTAYLYDPINDSFMRAKKANPRVLEPLENPFASKVLPMS